MRRADFDFDLPTELIAQRPLDERSASRLLAVLPGALEDLRFDELPRLLVPGDLLVLNDTRVLPARVLGRRRTGGRVEILLERLTGAREARAQIRAGRPLPAGTEILLPDDAVARVLGRDGALYLVSFDRDAAGYFACRGQVPLPPYISRPPEATDRERYQTVFARVPGAVAAPTAGLHFDARTLETLNGRGVETAFLTLHVGLGTFEPVRCERIEEHSLHPEWIDVSPAVCERVAEAKKRGGRVVAVGTTVVRALESASKAGGLAPWSGDTRLFIYPGYRFNVVDALITNFHLPQSSLLMLVAAFAGRERILEAYRHAVGRRYRFFSYGDAMFVTPAAGAAVGP
jgi:S-adenosylmethionine:tRNA ribosyltransferase-isomerase